MSDYAEKVHRRRPHATLACYMCRKRKIKCGRELPHCMICKETSQECIYPTKPMRPGPKIGSTHATAQKRQLGRESQEKSAQERRNVRIEPRRTTQTSTIDDYSSPSSVPSQSSQKASRPDNVQSLSFVLHPTVGNCSPDQTDATQYFEDTDSGYTDALMTSCKSLGLTLLQLNTLLPRYFETFTSFQLFRLTVLRTKLRQIPTATQRTALLAAMLAFGLKGLDKEDLENVAQEQILPDSTEVPSIYFRALGIKYVEQAIAELGDEPLSLPLLQAMILNTHCLLVQNVRGKAWRYLGTCIRTAYELNLHLIDADKQSHEHIANVEKWCIEEEWRRAWWAIWEMDVFASVIRRCPAGIDWTQNETFLPAEDERWYRGEPQQSCCLDVNVTTRWKALAATKNRSPCAWFILLNSLMKDAQNISSPTGIDKPHLSDPALSQEAGDGVIDEHQRLILQKKAAATKRLSIISNALYCAVMALPEEHKYHGQHLNFGGVDLQRPGAVAQRLAHNFIYSIYFMTQLTKLMILKFHVFRSGINWTLHKTPDHPAADFEPQHLLQYFEAADNVVSMIRDSAEDHYKHVNPFLASTAWLAGAVQLLRRSRLSDDDPDRDLVTSNFELVRLTYEKTVDFWNMPRVPLHNWEMLDSGLEGIIGKSRGPQATMHAEATSNTAVDRNGVNDNSGCSTSDGGMRDGLTETSSSIYHNATFSTLSPPQYQHQPHAPFLSTSRHLYRLAAPPPLVGHPPHHEPNLSISMTTLDAGAGAEGVPSFPSTDVPVAAFSPTCLDAMPFAVDRDMNMDFSSYLDEMFSGSYLP
ncbi:uncharacterized protein PV07_03382 [Cladophialophora immunda]|uniref:Zn(2)-C6 fungal-type domain-containing protein n=1 Tax=Cladophialophora immunda TaxID=569365 RepID=A0A0D2CP37_9EURO|nr:uncharacterized protein PV07_03382 [Cladophialophora immunda]KIW31790.1 hypothetical protein PV07_03382 [Cladophialophora immunda]OQV01433.1 Fungal specific transcription factor domain-containing protein [Cladophialophora immunda]